MKLRLLIAICVLLIPASVFAENWTKFFTSNENIDFFYNKETISYTDKDTVLIWYRTVPQKNAKFKLWKDWIELREVDCSLKRYKRLQGKRNMTEKLEKTDWISFGTSDLYIAFYNVACSEKNKTNK
jgi:hypothetical protein